MEDNSSISVRIVNKRWCEQNEKEIGYLVEKVERESAEFYRNHFPQSGKARY